MLPRFLRIASVAALSLCAAHAEDLIFDGTARTPYRALNDLIHRVPPYSLRHERYLSTLSAVQEQVILHERRMRGDGLPEFLRAQLSGNYSDILNALIEDRITEEYGRELLGIHRQLVDLAYQWASRKSPDEYYGEVLVEGLKEMDSELAERSAPLAAVPDEVRTPILNGHQLWIEELMRWGCVSQKLSLGDLGRLEVHADRLERDEQCAKRDGCLTRRERERLHGRMIDLQRLVIEVLEH